MSRGSEALGVRTFPQGGAVVHALVVVLVLGAEVGVVVVAQRVSGVSAVVGQEELVAVELVAQAEGAVLGVASVSRPVLRRKNTLTGELSRRAPLGEQPPPEPFSWPFL